MAKMPICVCVYVYEGGMEGWVVMAEKAGGMEHCGNREEM